MRTRKGLQTILSSLLFLFFFLSIFNSAYSSVSADTNAVAYFPLMQGNKYIYHYYDSYTHLGTTTTSSGDVLAKVSDNFDTIVNGKRYFRLNGFPSLSNNFYRVDSISGSLMMSEPNNSCEYYSHIEKFIDSLAALANNEIKFCGQTSSNTSYKCFDIRDTNILTINTLVKKFRNVTNISLYQTTFNRDYAKNIGLVYYSYFSDFGWQGGQHSTYYKLKGCVLNGVVYGDTTQRPIASLTQLNSLIPSEFSLSQNYPNPFNPTTTISFDVPKNSFVKLKIYDVSGKELAILVNENLNIGSYNYQWDASNFPSGIYFYKLEANDFVDTKRMVLLK